MNTSHLNLALTLLDTLRRELIDEAFDLEQQSRLDAADLAIAAANRIASARRELRRRAVAAGNAPPPVTAPDFAAVIDVAG